MFHQMRSSPVLFFLKVIFPKKNQTVKFGAFMPPPDSKDLSVFRISSISDSEVWRIGVEGVQGSRTLKARGGSFGRSCL